MLDWLSVSCASSCSFSPTGPSPAGNALNFAGASFLKPAMSVEVGIRGSIAHIEVSLDANNFMSYATREPAPSPAVAS
jgi:hypothetical protein